MRTKVIDVANGLYIRYVVVYSFDGRTWSTSKRDLLAYVKRYDHERRILQQQFKLIDTAEIFDIRY